MLCVDLIAKKNDLCRRAAASRPVTLFLVGGVLVLACDDGGVPSCSAQQQQGSLPSKNQKGEGSRDGKAERKLLAELLALDASMANHSDSSRLDRELAAAFRSYGLDLDVVDPETAGTRLAGHPESPEIAAMIDVWTRFRHKELKIASWRRLVDVARAADPDPWRNALRDQEDRAPADALPVLRARAADGAALEKQPANSLIILYRMLTQPTIDRLPPRSCSLAHDGFHGISGSASCAVTCSYTSRRRRIRWRRPARMQRLWGSSHEALWPVRAWPLRCIVRESTPTPNASSVQQSGSIPTP